MSDATPGTIYLKDYSQPDYLIDTVDLHFELQPENTLVRSTLSFYRNPASSTENAPLQLMGEALTLESIKLDGVTIAEADYLADESSLVIHTVPERFTLEIITHINPKANTALEGLYLSNGLFCTQCEAEGFRKITYFLDRPDVMARYTTTIVADKTAYPVLLSNGNRIDSGEQEEGRHWVKWEDPHPKP
ncbi:MAG: aminopeptidase N, partial [Gammaproteobacteria bacterium]